MSDARRYFMGFVFRVSACTVLLLLCCLAQRLWPGSVAELKEKLFYSVNYGLLVKELRELGRCVLPG